ncbi:PAS domain-containing sensor histidine kinase [Candidatus Pacebacteria bacterium]|nr:PAS domain-containing sensor histidine kinase [Candidatus Paceibacterota bacterium]
MKFTFQIKWVKNGLVFFAGVTAVGAAIINHSYIESVATPERFFLVVLIVGILLVCSIFLLTTISARAAEIANSRTANLLETQKLFVELYRNSPVPYVLIDHTGRVTYPNHAAVHLFGLVEDTFEGKNIFEMFEVLDDTDGMKTALVSSLFHQGVFVDGKDVLITRIDGTTRFGLLSIFSYGDFASKKKGLMTIVDITKQKEIEKAKTEFVSLASHQLRTPVSSMKWNLELMTSAQFGAFNEKQQEYAKKIGNSLSKMNALIDDFLNASQLELGTKAITYEKIELASFMDSICEEFVGRINGKKLQFIRRYDERVVSVEADRALLHMVVSNLVSNATKYTPESGEVILQYMAGSESITVSVIDTGVGIPLEDQEKLFTKFFRAQNVRKNVTEGTGLGLYIVKLAVLKLGGTISVRSKENEGTAFDVVLPYSSSGRML